MDTKYTSAFSRMAEATIGQLVARDRVDRVKRIARAWAFMQESGRIPEKYPCEIWPGVERITAAVRLDMVYTYELPAAERAILDGIVRHQRPRTIFEFGTFTGATTALLADAAPDDSLVHTIDLPDSAFPAGGFGGWFTSDLVGKAFAADERYKDRIVLHRQDLNTFDFEALEGRVDLVFVDASHTYEAVLHDSRCALRILAPGGTIIWDDYQPAQWDSVRALNKVAARRPLIRVTNTRLVIYQHNR